MTISPVDIEVAANDLRGVAHCLFGLACLAESTEIDGNALTLLGGLINGHVDTLRELMKRDDAARRTAAHQACQACNDAD